VEEMDYEKLQNHSSKYGRIKNELWKEKPGDETVGNIRKKLKKENRSEMRKGRRRNRINMK